MVNRPLKTSRPLAAFLIGLLGTLLVLIAFWTGLDPRTELRALDMRFGFIDAELPDNILHIDIDDKSLEAVEQRWPWPRERFASIIDILTECGAKAVMVDLIFDHPELCRYKSARDAMHPGSNEEENDLLGDAPPQPIYDDLLLASSIAREGNVYLTIHISMVPQSSAIWDIHNDVSRFMSDNPDNDFSVIFKGFQKSDRDTAHMAYLHHQALLAMERFTIPSGHVGALNVRSGWMTPPLRTFAELAAGVGCIAPLHDADKLVRRTPLFFRGHGHVYPQFAVAVALNELASRHGGMTSMQADKSSVTVQYNDGTKRVIPLDSDGTMIIRWPREAIGSTTYGLDHISANSVVHIGQEKNLKKRNEKRIQLLRMQFVNMGKNLPKDEELTKIYRLYAPAVTQFNNACNDLIEAEEKCQRALLYSPHKVTSSKQRLSEARQKEADTHKRLEDTLAYLTTKLREPGNLEVFLKIPASNQVEPAERAELFLKAMARAKKIFAMEAKLQQENLELDANIKSLTDKLR
ncbi:MAG: CHASE2 domain-containing protein, partial [bacterium]|nr:CHASE2 domain-containing protein [bacterium]